MKEVDITSATASLADYARAVHKEAVVVTESGRPVAVVLSLEDVDRETLSLSTNPEFLEILRRSRTRRAAEGGITSDQMRQRLGLK